MIKNLFKIAVRNIWKRKRLSGSRGHDTPFRFRPNCRLMTRDTALKYFGDEDPIGKSLTTPQGEFLVAAIEEKWKQYMPGQPFSYFFLDDRLNELYNNEKISGQIFNVFSILTIFIACVGLFGLSPKSPSVSRPSRRPMLILPMPSGRSEAISV